MPSSGHILIISLVWAVPCPKHCKWFSNCLQWMHQCIILTLTLHCSASAGVDVSNWAWVIEKIFSCEKIFVTSTFFKPGTEIVLTPKGTLQHSRSIDISMCKICMNLRRLLFKSKAKYSVCFTNCCANKMFPNVCRSSSVIKTFSGKLENKLQIRRLNFQKLTKLDQARLLLFDQTNPEKF